MRSMISGAKPGPSSPMVDLDLVVVPDARRPRPGRARNRRRFPGDCRGRRGSPDCAPRPARRIVRAGVHRRFRRPKSRCGATTSSIRADSGIRSNGSPLADNSVSLPRMTAAALRLLAQQPHVLGMRESGSISRSSSRRDHREWSKAACRAHGRRRRRARRAGTDAARAPAPARWRRARRTSWRDSSMICHA